MKLIKVIMLKSMAGSKGFFPCGSVRELEQGKAQHLVDKKFAKFAEEIGKEAPKNNGNTKVSNKNTTSKRANKSKRGKKPSKG